MSTNFIEDLLNALERVFSPDRKALKEVIIISGMPDATQNVRYPGYNRQVEEQASIRRSFSAVALINNRRAEQWQLRGHFKKVSQLVFNPRWTRNELDLFINALRCSPGILSLIGSANAAYSLLGIIEIQDRGETGIFKRWSRRIRPVIVVPGLDEKGRQAIADFEHLNEVRKPANWIHSR